MLLLATDEVSDEPRAHLSMVGRALQNYSRDFFFTGQNSDFWSKSVSTRDQWQSPTLQIFVWACPTQPLARVDERWI